MVAFEPCQSGAGDEHMPRAKIRGLTPRRLAVLQAVVEEHIAHGEPVSSATVRSRHSVDASPATIRLDMAALERMGLLDKPHTSSGRVPTARGYRTYVEHLQQPRLGPREETVLRSELRKAAGPMDAVSVAARVVAELTRLATLAAFPLAQDIRLQEIQLRPVSGRMVLASYLLTDGRTGEALVQVDQSVSDELLASWREAAARLRGARLHELASAAAWHPVPDRVWRSIVEQIAPRAGVRVIFEGASHLAAQPEFGGQFRLADLLSLMEHRGRVYCMLASTAPASGTQTLIAPRDMGEGLLNCALVVSAFGPRNRGGRLAVLGPIRMHYRRSIAAAAAAAELLEEKWAEAEQPTA